MTAERPSRPVSVRLPARPHRPSALNATRVIGTEPAAAPARAPGLEQAPPARVAVERPLQAAQCQRAGPPDAQPQQQRHALAGRQRQALLLRLHVAGHDEENTGERKRKQGESWLGVGPRIRQF